MTMRITGMNSGLDTESIIKELVKAKSTKVESLTKEKTKAEWKQEAWTSLNTKIKSFYNTLSNFRFSSSYKKKSTTVSNSSAVSVITGDAAMSGVQELTISSLAKSGYMTGSKLTAKEGAELSSSTKVSDLALPKDSEGNEVTGLASLSAKEGSFSVTVNGKTTNISVKSDSTITDVVGALKNAGVDANYDEKNQRIYIASKTSGSDNDFAITANNAEGFTALSALGLNESLGTSVDPAVNPNAKTLSQYKQYQSLYSQLSSIPTKTIDVEEKYTETEEVKDDDGNTVYEEDGVTPKTQEVEKTRTVQKTVDDGESFFSSLSVDSDLYKAIKAEMTTEDDYDDALAKLKEKTEFANTMLTDTTTYSAAAYSGDAVRISGSDASITLNGVEYSSSTNNVEVNGLTFTCLAVTSDPITVTTQDDTDGIYDMIKDLFKQYNELINEMDKLYNAENKKDYQPLTDDEKDAMSEKEIEKWEQTIKDSILRKDSSLSTVFSGLKESMLNGYEINGKKVYLSNFGIETLSYFLAEDNEHNAFHIAGDPDDSSVSTEGDKLKTAIANEPDTVVEFFTNLARDLYKKMTDLGAATDYSSSSTWFEDKQYKTDISNYKSKISDAEDALSAYEDKYYKKFSNMEVALSKLESSTSSITSLLGSN